MLIAAPDELISTVEVASRFNTPAEVTLMVPLRSVASVGLFWLTLKFDAPTLAFRLMGPPEAVVSVMPPA